MILEASFSNVIFYICKCKWVPVYHLCMQMIDLAFAHQAQIIFGHYTTDGQLQCESHLFKERQAKNRFRKVVPWFLYCWQHTVAEVSSYSYTILWREFFHTLSMLLFTLFSKRSDTILWGCALQKGREFLKLILAWAVNNYTLTSAQKLAERKYAGPILGDWII